MSDGGTLRDQQAEFTKQLLLEAARKVIVECDPDDFTMQKVAEVAGVSHRTVYRYFPSRQSLINEFSEWIEQRFDSGPVPVDRALLQLKPDLRAMFARFDRHSEYFEAAARLSGGTIRPASQAQRTERLRQIFDREFPDLDPEAANKAFAIIRLLVGLQTWFVLRDRFGLEDGETGDAVTWAVELLIEGLHEGRIPEQTAEQVTDTSTDNKGNQ